MTAERELIADEFARFLREEGAAHRPWDFADAILSALDLPGRDERVRRQVAEEIAQKIDEKAEQIRGSAWTIALAAVVAEGAAIARSHSQYIGTEET